MNNSTRYLVPLTVLACFTLYFSYDLFALKKLLAHPDIQTYYYPLRQWFLGRLLNGEFPLWNPSWGLGQPADVFSTIPLDIYTPLEIIFGAQYHYFLVFELALILLTAFYVLLKLGFSISVSTAGAILYFLSPWVAYFYFYFLVGNAFLGYLLAFHFAYQWFKTENPKHLFYIAGAFALGMLGTKLEFWFYNAALLVFYAGVMAVLFYSGKTFHSVKLAVLACMAMVLGLLTQAWQINILLSVFKISRRTVDHSLLKLFSPDLYVHVLASIWESDFFKILATEILLYLGAKTKIRPYATGFFLAGAIMAMETSALIIAFAKGPVFVGAIIGILLALLIPENRDWREQVKTAAFFLLFVYYWCRPGTLGFVGEEMTPIREAPAMFRMLFATLVWLGCGRIMKDKLAGLAYLAIIFVFIMRDQGQIFMGWVTGIFWVPTRDNYTIDWAVTLIAVSGLTQLQPANHDHPWSATLKRAAIPIVIGIAVFASFSNPYYMHGLIRELPPGSEYPYYRGITPVRTLLRELRDSPTWRIFFHHKVQSQGYSWGFGASLMESVNQVTEYSSIPSESYTGWSLFRRTGIKPVGNWGCYSMGFTEKTMSHLPKRNTLGLGHDALYKYFLEGRPPLSKSALEFLGVKHVIMPEPLPENLLSKLAPKNIRKYSTKTMHKIYDQDLKVSNALYVAEMENPLPRAFLAYGVSPYQQKEFQEEMNPTIIPSAIKTANFIFPFLPAQIDSYEPEKISITAEASEAAKLVLLDLNHPYWHARLDGKEVPIHQAFYMFRSVEVPPGVHVVEFYYELPHIKFYSILSATVLLITLVAYFYLLQRGTFSRPISG